MLHLISFSDLTAEMSESEIRHANEKVGFTCMKHHFNSLIPVYAIFNTTQDHHYGLVSNRGQAINQIIEHHITPKVGNYVLIQQANIQRFFQYRWLSARKM